MTPLAQLDRTILLCRDHVIPTLSDQEILNKFQSLQVLCIADHRNLSSHSGQTALITLVSLLSRMGVQVGLSIPEIAMLSPQPPFSGDSVGQALTASSETLVTGATVRCDADFNPHLIFALGDTNVEVHHRPCWILSGDDWLSALTMLGLAKQKIWTARLPVGGMVSAAMAANEAFKFVMRQLPLRSAGDQVFFEQSLSCCWDFDAIAVPENGIEVGSVDLISAGASSQAALFALSRFPDLTMRGRIFDSDITEESNLNRNMLSLVGDVGLPKVQIAARRCGNGIVLEPVNKRFSGDDVEAVLSDRVLVGVDHIPSRWSVQQKISNWSAVGGTSHFNVSSSVHTTKTPCSGCLHPVDDAADAERIPTVSFVSFWAGLATTVRLIREALAQPYSLDRQHLWLTPLRMDLPHAAMWLPVAPRADCPVKCASSESLRGLPGA